jgi:transmembrane sensor
MGMRQEDDSRLVERAAQWLGTLEESNSERTAFFNWLAESPRHVDAFLSVLATAQEVAGLTPEQLKRIEQMGDGDRPGVGNVVPLAHTPLPLWERVPARKRGRVRGIAAGVAAALILAIGAWFFTTSREQTYSTAIGEQRILELEDGSLVHLDTRSRLEVHYDSEVRSLRLLEGQALFDVKQDVSRPFQVSSGDSVIQAVGTKFEVYRRVSGTRVAVLEGAVRVSPKSRAAQNGKSLLTAGESADISSTGKILQRKPVNVAQAAAWQQRRLVFREDTLGEIAAEFNRYNVTPQIRVEGAAAMDQHFSGTFNADAPETLMQALAGDGSLRVERNRDEIVIRKR